MTTPAWPRWPCAMATSFRPPISPAGSGIIRRPRLRRRFGASVSSRLHALKVKKWNGGDRSCEEAEMLVAWESHTALSASVWLCCRRCVSWPMQPCFCSSNAGALKTLLTRLAFWELYLSFKGWNSFQEAIHAVGFRDSPLPAQLWWSRFGCSHCCQRCCWLH